VAALSAAQGQNGPVNSKSGLALPVSSSMAGSGRADLHHADRVCRFRLRSRFL
jgi:hypothetical protein